MVMAKGQEPESMKQNGSQERDVDQLILTTVQGQSNGEKNLLIKL